MGLSFRCGTGTGIGDVFHLLAIAKVIIWPMSSRKLNSFYIVTISFKINFLAKAARKNYTTKGNVRIY